MFTLKKNPVRTLFSRLIILCTALDLGRRMCIWALQENFEPTILEIQCIIGIILQTEVYLIWDLFARCCFTSVFNHLSYLTVTSCYLIREREHGKYPSVLHGRLSYYTLVSQFKGTKAIINKGISVE